MNNPMNKPLTTDEAYVEFECYQCREFPLALKRLREFFKHNSNPEIQPNLFYRFQLRSIDLEFVAKVDCEGDCVESNTASVPCINCKERVWFSWYGDLPEHFKCPYCKKTTYNSMAETHNKMRAERWTSSVNYHPKKNKYSALGLKITTSLLNPSKASGTPSFKMSASKSTPSTPYHALHHSINPVVHNKLHGFYN